MAQVYVARHGETAWNREGRYQGQLESSLTATGLAQAQALARALAPLRVDRIVASPLARCMQSAIPLAAAHALQVQRDDRLLEIAHGDWEGRLRAEIERDDPQTLQAWRERPSSVQFRGGERLQEVRERWLAFADTIVGKSTIIVVTHDVLVRLAILEARGASLDRLWEPRVINGGFSRYTVENGRWTLLEECADGHLGGLQVDVSQQAL